MYKPPFQVIYGVQVGYFTAQTINNTSITSFKQVNRINNTPKKRKNHIFYAQVHCSIKYTMSPPLSTKRERNGDQILPGMFLHPVPNPYS
jgi:hypothetical protein